MVANRAVHDVDIRFAIETAVGFDGGQDLRYCALRLNHQTDRLPLYEIAAVGSVSSYQTDTNLRNLTLITELSRPAHLWRFPLETITQSEAGFERGYQGTVFLQWWPLQLAGGATWSVTITQRVIQDSSK